MRIVLRIALALCVLVALALGGLLLLLPRLVASDAVRERIVREARAATGLDVRYDEVSIGLLPPRLVVKAPRVAGAEPTEPPLFEAEAVGLRLTLLPLLFGSLVIDQVRVEGATVRLVRTPDGIELPEPKRGTDERPTAPTAAPAPEAEPEAGGGGIAVAVREARLRDARIFLTDRTVFRHEGLSEVLDCTSRHPDDVISYNQDCVYDREPGRALPDSSGLAAP